MRSFCVEIETIDDYDDSCRRRSLLGLQRNIRGVDNSSALHRLLLSTHQADELARELQPSG